MDSSSPEHESDPGGSGDESPSPSDDAVTRVEGSSTQPQDASPGHDTLVQQRIAAQVHSRLFQSGPVAARIGRFTVLDTLGKGGMGMVYSAYDDQLDRKVAIKVLRDDDLPDQSVRLRFQREAQALARLSHPNVVTVHEVGHGDDDDEMYLAMEFIRGQNLEVWRREQEPAWPQILEAFVQAGRGLAAAHAAGLVHRDFKPQNVMRSNEGAVKVLDFGLARAVETEPTGDDQDATTETGADPSVDAPMLSSSSSLTVPGMVMGTPPYMSPEQHVGKAADHRSDQYGFCVALWEALTGQRPFPAPDYPTLIKAKFAGPPSWPSAAPSLPRAVLEALRRGLSPKPEDRWPDMGPLLDQLAWDPSLRRNRWLGVLVGLSALGVGVAAAQGWSRDGSAQCTGAAQQLEGVWDDARRAEVEAAVLGLGKSYVSVAWKRTARELDIYAQDWAAMHTEACEATAVRAEQSPQLLDLRMACLHRATLTLRATVDTLAEADTTVMKNAHALVAGLDPLSHCADTEALTAEVAPPPPEHAEAVDTARQQLARAHSLEQAGRYDAAREAIEQARQTLKGVEYEPIWSRVKLYEGSVLRALGDFEGSVAALSEALRRTAQWKQWGMMGTTAEMLMFVLGNHLRRPDEGMRYRALAEGLATGDPIQRASVHSSLGAVFEMQGQYADAEAEIRAALALYEQHQGPDSISVAASRSNLGGVLQFQGKEVEAEAEFRATLAIRERALGPDHPVIGQSLSNLATALHGQGKFEESEAMMRRSVAKSERALGSDHPHVAQARNNLAGTLYGQRRHEEAEREFRAVVEIQQKVFGPDHPAVASTRSNVAICLLALGKLDEAETELRAALAVQQKAFGPDHPVVVSTRSNLGNALFEAERFEDSEVEYRAVLTSREASMDADHPRLAGSRFNLASLLITTDRPAEAVPLLEKAWDRRQREDIPPHQRAETAFMLAQALWATERAKEARDRARTLAQKAAKLYRDGGETYAEELQDVERWLDARG